MATALRGLRAALASLCNRRLDMAAPLHQAQRLPRRTDQPGDHQPASLAIPQAVQWTPAQVNSSLRPHHQSFVALLRNPCRAAGLTPPAATVHGQYWARRHLLHQAVATRRPRVPGCLPPRRRRQAKTGALIRRALRSLPARRSAALHHPPCSMGSQLHLRARPAAMMVRRAIGRPLNLASVGSHLAAARRASTAPLRLILQPVLVAPLSPPPAGKCRCLPMLCQSSGS